MADQLPKVEELALTKAGGNTGLRQSKHAAAARPETVTVRRGDSLFSLAEEVLGKVPDNQLRRYVTRIYRHNRRVIGGNPDLIRPGQVLRLPRIGQLGASPRESGGTAVSAAALGDLTVGDHRTANLSDLAADRMVRVRRGDTLWSIANEAMDAVLSPSELRKVTRYLPLVGRSNLPALISIAAQSNERPSGHSVERFVDLVYKSNKAVIGPNPNIIRPGQVIALPLFAGSPEVTFDNGPRSPHSVIQSLSRSTGGLSGLAKEVGVIAGVPVKRLRSCCKGPQDVSMVANAQRRIASRLAAGGALRPTSRKERDTSWVYPTAVGALILMLLSALGSTPSGRHRVRPQPRTGDRRRLGSVRSKGMRT